MLKNLKIKNYAIISEVNIDFAGGFNVITGETGAGKSILLGGLGLILGKRVDTGILNQSNSKCIIEGHFDISRLALKLFFDQHELDYDTDTIVRREILPNGKSRAFINDTPVNLATLKELAEKLIDIHSQHQSIQLNDAAFQLSILDGLANNTEILRSYQFKYQKLLNLTKQLQELRTKEIQAKKDLDYYNFQLNEIESLKPVEGEEKELEEELLILSNAEKIKSNLQQFTYLLEESDQSILSQIEGLKQLINEVSSFNPRLENAQERMESMITEFKDIQFEMTDFDNEIELDNQKLDEISERLSALNRLLNKHQIGTTKELLSYQNELKDKLTGITNLEEDIESTQKELNTLNKQVQELAEELKLKRKKVIPGTEQKIESLLRNLGMKNAKIQFKLINKDSFTSTGTDKLDILFSTNPGVEPYSIQKVASGGELSRLMLAIKYLLADSYQIPTIIFDEIDMGISGEIAIKVGEMLSLLAKNHQLLSITHLPQIAAMGKEHLFIYKETDGVSTETKIKNLTNEDKINEIAKMIGGENPSETAILSSKELVKKFS